MCKKIKNLFFTGFQGVTIAVVIILLVCPLSCKLTAEGIDIIKGDYTSPKMSECLVLDDKHLELDFSEKVDVTGVSISKNEQSMGKDLVGKRTINCYVEENEKENVIITLENSTEIGSSYIVTGVVEDGAGNSLTFSVPFSGYNGKIPRLIITELQNESSGGSSSLGLYRGEFVRFLALDDGNLFGLSFGCASKPKDNYVFPAINVSKGESIILHLQQKGNGCVSEEDDDLNIASNDYTENGIRDLWRNIPDSILGNKCDVIYLKDNIKNEIVQGIAYSDGSKTEWADNYVPYVKQLAELNLFNAEDIGNACNVKSVTSKKTLQRKNVADIENMLKNNVDIDSLYSGKDDYIVCGVKDGFVK